MSLISFPSTPNCSETAGIPSDVPAMKPLCGGNGGKGGTVTVNDWLAVRPAELVTVTVMVDEPDCVVTGASEIVRKFPLPPKVMLATGSNVVFDEVAETVRLAAAVSGSATMNVYGPPVLLIGIEMFDRPVIEGGPAGGVVTVTVKADCAVMPSLSVTVTVIRLEPVWP